MCINLCWGLTECSRHQRFATLDGGYPDSIFYVGKTGFRVELAGLDGISDLEIGTKAYSGSRKRKAGRSDIKTCLKD